VGWKVNPVNMGEYDDYSMQQPESNTDVVGVCHAKGVNADLPPQWLMYIKVADLAASIEPVRSKGGELLTKVNKLVLTANTW